jgi:hypothetical protein
MAVLKSEMVLSVVVVEAFRVAFVDVADIIVGFGFIGAGEYHFI